MEPFKKLEAMAVSIQIANIDTDQIIPARFLKTPRSVNHGEFLFHDMRRNSDGGLDPNFILNDPNNKDTQILVADANFGCGSSRESAVYALFDGGIKCVIAPSFGDIFYNNSTKNGLLPIVLERSKIEKIWHTLETANNTHIEVSLEDQTIHLPNGTTFEFEIDAFRKQSLLEGLDDIDLTLKYNELIKSHENAQSIERPWIVPIC
jgi:3-isopropylmalate/(R)-2-methylmalate dehydratase small subunit